MQTVDAVVVGGGPAGSTAAWKLKGAGLDVLVLDRAAFPRSKLCAGWVTPEALADLQLEPSDYPLSFMTFDELHVHWRVFSKRLRAPQHSIRRYEFDEFLLRRSAARVMQHDVRAIRRDNGDYVIDDGLRCKYLVGAGGTACPVYRALFRKRLPRDGALQIATYEQEFAYDWHDPACHLWFFDGGLPGYAWYVPKANGYINVGLGGMAVALAQSERHLRDHWSAFVAKLEKRGLVSYSNYKPKGYSYYLRDRADRVSDKNAFIVGDAVGLATRDMGEGIGPAVKSGLLAANAIINDADYRITGIEPFSGSGLVTKRFRAPLRWLQRFHAAYANTSSTLSTSRSH